MPRSVRESRYWPNVVRGEGCWEWRGAHNPKGYALYSNTYAHRAAYRLAKGEIPEGLEIDHLCRNRGCVNPDHLEAVDHLENVQRARRDSCSNGHAYVHGSHRVRPDGTRVCLVCHQIVERRAVKRKTNARFGHRVMRHPDGGWGCKCGVWLAPTQEKAWEAARPHRDNVVAEEQKALEAAAEASTRRTYFGPDFDPSWRAG